MGRKLVICCDGTNNEFGPQNTNVVRLFQSLDRDPNKQHVYYDPGVGTLPEPGWVTWAGRMISDVAGLAFGAGLMWKVQQAYTFLMRMWEPGDQVFLFGFSRGAYTARVLAGLLNELGLLPHASDNLLPYATRLYQAALKDHRDSAGNKSKYWKLRDEFRWTFARPVPSGDPEKRFPIHFVGLWDTVSSVGWVWDPPKFPFTTENAGIQIIRHAVSLDERRWFFRQNLFDAKPGQDMLQHWFAGVHCDVGGGYPESDGGLWRVGFEWILDEAHKAGLGIDPERKQMVLNRAQVSAAPWNERQHESLTALWWPLEFFPKLYRKPGSHLAWPDMGMGRHRTVDRGQPIHRSALLRIREKPDYNPPNLKGSFLNKVRALTEVPEWLAYDPD